MSIRFARLASGDGARVAHLQRGPGQDAFTDDPATRLAGLGPAEDGWAILQDDSVVGFLVLDRAYAAAHVFAEDDEIGLRSVLIDAARQGAGLGRAAILALPALVRAEYPGVRCLVLTVNQRNAAAHAAYLRAGFTEAPTLYLGGRSGPQHIMRLAV